MKREQERTELETITAELTREGELVVSASWDGSLCRVAMYKRGSVYIVTFQRNFMECEITLDTWRDFAFAEFVDSLIRVGRLPARIEGESAVADWCRGAAGLGEEVPAPAEEWAQWYKDAITEISPATQ